MIRRTFDNLSIRLKLMVLMISVSVLVLSLSSVIIFTYHQHVFEQATIAKVRTQASLVGESVRSAVIFDDKMTATETLKALVSDPYIESASVVFPDRTSFVSYPETPNNLVDDFPLHDYAKFFDRHMVLVHAVNDSHGPIAYTVVHSNLEELTAIKKNNGAVIIVVTVAGILAACLVSFYANKIVSGPLMFMVNYVKGVSETKDYSQRMSLNRRDELGTLVDGFHHLLDAVGDREKALKDHRDSLQSIVDRRTEELYEKAHFDPLTGLPNRILLMDRLEHATRLCERNDQQLAVLFLDLDRFKIINDSLGHAIGDELLFKVSTRLSGAVRDIDVVARLGGDEFVVLMEQINSPNDAAHMAQEILDCFVEPFKLQNHVVYANTSIGVSIFPEDGKDYSLLLKHADVSMYHSKEKGAGNYTFYEKQMNESSHERLELESQLRGAIANNEFHLMYQPQINVAENTIYRLEALLRWQHPKLGNVPPDKFITIAEEIGYINQIGLWVITESFRQLAEWQEQGLDSIGVAVNISASELIDQKLIEHIREQSELFGVSTSKLELEITEEVFMDHPHETIAILSSLRKAGIQIAIDDFGTGYSSLQYLKDLPVDVLKIDGMFIRDMLSNPASMGIVVAMSTLVHTQGMKFVAECVETKEQLEVLRNIHCDYAQGYFFYKPLPPEEVPLAVSQH